MLRVGDRITNHVLQEHLQDTTSLLVDQARDTFDTTTTSQTADSRLRDTLDVVAKHLPMSFSSSFTQTLSTFTTTRHLS
ncbi:unnamed protein product, partial [Heterobilharzia americana]